MADSAHKDWKEDLKKEFNAKTDFEIISGRDKEKIDKAKKSGYIEEGQAANAEFLGLTAMRKYIKNKADKYRVSQYEVWKFLEGKINENVTINNSNNYCKIYFWRNFRSFLKKSYLPTKEFPFFWTKEFPSVQNLHLNAKTCSERNEGLVYLAWDFLNFVSTLFLLILLLIISASTPHFLCWIIFYVIISIWFVSKFFACFSVLDYYYSDNLPEKGVDKFLVEKVKKHPKIEKFFIYFFLQ
ncbi:hypothetical protein ACN083_03630 [Rothia sp. CCM 9418]|uniref:hypothetical protein n=1 Tax=Rothia sp. CCM 9418 TaxID=3402661 RepID=UPI003AE31EFD